MRVIKDFFTGVFKAVLWLVCFPFFLVIFKASIRERYDERINMTVQEFRGYKLRDWVVDLLSRFGVSVEPYKLYFRQ